MLAINSVTSSGVTVFTSHTRSGYSSGQPFGPSHTHSTEAQTQAH